MKRHIIATILVFAVFINASKASENSEILFQKSQDISYKDYPSYLKYIQNTGIGKNAELINVYKHKMDVMIECGNKYKHLKTKEFEDRSCIILKKFVENHAKKLLSVSISETECMTIVEAIIAIHNIQLINREKEVKIVCKNCSDRSYNQVLQDAEVFIKKPKTSTLTTNCSCQREDKSYIYDIYSNISSELQDCKRKLENTEFEGECKGFYRGHAI